MGAKWEEEEEEENDDDDLPTSLRCLHIASDRRSTSGTSICLYFEYVERECFEVIDGDAVHTVWNVLYAKSSIKVLFVFDAISKLSSMELIIGYCLPLYVDN